MFLSRFVYGWGRFRLQQLASFSVVGDFCHICCFVFVVDMDSMDEIVYWKCCAMLPMRFRRKVECFNVCINWFFGEFSTFRQLFGCFNEREWTFFRRFAIEFVFAWTLNFSGNTNFAQFFSSRLPQFNRGDYSGFDLDNCDTVANNCPIHLMNLSPYTDLQ